MGLAWTLTALRHDADDTPQQLRVLEELMFAAIRLMGRGKVSEDGSRYPDLFCNFFFFGGGGNSPRQFTCTLLPARSLLILCVIFWSSSVNFLLSSVHILLLSLIVC